LDAEPAWRKQMAAAGYFGMIVATVILFVAIRSWGQHLHAPSPPQGGTTFGATVASAKPEVLVHVLLSLLTIVVTCRAVGALFLLLRQPPVIGEVIAGILLGPSLLGRIAPELSAYLLPTQVAPFLGVIAQLGVILYMFSVGLELDVRPLRGRGHAAVATSHASIIAPFLLGAGLSLWLYPRFSTSDVPFTVFALFMGVAMSVTAFPVLARILTDRGMNRSPLGILALTCAAVDDVTAWCLLALVVGIAKSQVAGALLVVVAALGYGAIMLILVRPLCRRLSDFDANEELSQGRLAVVLSLLLLSAWMTERLGIHAVFGAFLFGVLIPHDSVLAREFGRKLQDVVAVLLLPTFFAFTGLRTQIGLVAGAQEWLACALIIVVATLGKFGGTFAAARWTGTGSRDAAALGILMNTRGLMELIVLNIGLDLKVISPTLFAMMVLMALVTTFATSPLLQWLRPDPPHHDAATPTVSETGAVG
jgi:Kef-type K+ transport system membrane component KefB